MQTHCSAANMRLPGHLSTLAHILLETCRMCKRSYLPNCAYVAKTKPNQNKITHTPLDDS